MFGNFDDQLAAKSKSAHSTTERPNKEDLVHIVFLSSIYCVHFSFHISCLALSISL